MAAYSDSEGGLFFFWGLILEVLWSRVKDGGWALNAGNERRLVLASRAGWLQVIRLAG